LAEARRRAPAAARRAATAAACTVAVLLAGCASGPRSGRDGPEASPPAGLERVPDAEPRVEPIRSGGPNKPYSVLGRSYVPIQDDRPFRESGLASWYGRKFHGQSTANGERYDMYAMTAAHPTLPLPSYVRVRNPANGREVIVRVNDRGPFHDGRVIDLSYTAAFRLDLLRGVAPVEITRITQEDIRTGAWRREGDGTALALAAPPAMAVAPAPLVAVPLAAVQPVVQPAPAPAPASSGWSVPLSVRGMPPAPPPAAPTPLPAAVPAPALPPAVAMAAPPAEPQAVVAREDGLRVQALPPLEPTPEPAPSPPPAAVAPGFWVQLGAFGRPEGAQQLQQQAARELQSLAPLLAVLNDRGLHRLQAGPFGSREAAARAAAQIRTGLQITPVIVERR